MSDDVTYNSENMRERLFREQCKRDTEALRQKLTFEEHKFIAFVPLVFAYLTFHYGERCRRYAADHRISILKSLGRAFDSLEKEYDNELSKDLDYTHRKNIKDESMRFVEMFEKDFQILWLSVNQEFKRKMPDWPYDDMRSDAICGMIMRSLYNEHAKYVAELIEKRLGKSQGDITNPKIESLGLILEAYAGEVGKFNFKDKNVQLAKKIIRNRVREIKFNITTE